MTKKERVLAAVEGRAPDCVPAGFSLHFPPEKNGGEAGVQAHLDFFRETDTDILKIMNENLVPVHEGVRGPADWDGVARFGAGASFLNRQPDFTKRILERCGDEGFTLGTLHGITASSIHSIEKYYGYDGARIALMEHLREDSGPVLDAMKRIAESMCELARGYGAAGVDGIYYAALGGERRWFTDEEFARWIKPFDQLILSEIRKTGCKVFLHICKDGLEMNRYKGYDQWCDVVNWGVYEAPCTLEEGKALFPGKTVMGGLRNRGGVIAQGTEQQLAQAARELADRYGKSGFILGADCTLPTETPYKRIRVLVDALREGKL